MVLWSYRTTSRSSIGETSFSLTYGIEAVLPLEILSKSLWVMGFETKTNEEERRQDMDMFNKKREAAQLRQASYESRVENFYNRRVQVKFFKVGE